MFPMATVSILYLTLYARSLYIKSRKNNIVWEVTKKIMALMVNKDKVLQATIYVVYSEAYPGFP